MMSMRAPGKIVIVSQYYAPDISTTATYMTAIANGLGTVSDVLVITGTLDSASVAQAKSWAPHCHRDKNPYSGKMR